MLYSPGKAEISKWPALSVIACITGPLRGSKATLDLGITAPVLSDTVPVIAEVWGACAEHERAIISTVNLLLSMKARLSLSRISV